MAERAAQEPAQDPSEKAQQLQETLAEKTQDLKESVEAGSKKWRGKGALLLQLLIEQAKLGPYLLARVMYAALSALPQGLPTAGAVAVEHIVDAGCADSNARITVMLVRLGFLDLVRDIVATLAQRRRSDAVAATTVALMRQNEVGTVVQINNALMSAGKGTEITKIAGEVMAQSGSAFFELAKEAGGNSLSWFGQSSDVATGADSPDQAPSKAQGKQEAKAAVHRAGAAVAGTAKDAKSWLASKLPGDKEPEGPAPGDAAARKAEQAQEAGGEAVQKGKESAQDTAESAKQTDLLSSVQHVATTAAEKVKAAVDEIVSPGTGAHGEAGEVKVDPPRVRGAEREPAAAAMDGGAQDGHEQMAAALNRVTDWGAAR